MKRHHPNSQTQRFWFWMFTLTFIYQWPLSQSNLIIKASDPTSILFLQHLFLLFLQQNCPSRVTSSWLKRPDVKGVQVSSRDFLPTETDRTKRALVYQKMVKEIKIDDCQKYQHWQKRAENFPSMELPLWHGQSIPQLMEGTDSSPFPQGT